MTSREITPEMFKSITFRHEEIPGLSVSKYRVYSDYHNYILVEAANAQDAINNSGVKDPVRVLRDSIYLENVLTLKKHPTSVADADSSTETLAIAEEPVSAEASAPEPEVMEPAASVQTSDGTLSNDDVNKLLNP